MLIPALLGEAGNYQPQERDTIFGLDGRPLAEVASTLPIVGRMAARRSRGHVDFPIHSLLSKVSRAATIFEQDQPDGLAPAQFSRMVAASSGLPITISRRRTLEFLPQLMRSLGTLLEIQSPAGLDVFDSYAYERHGIAVGFVPSADNVAFVMPGNHPSTHALWLGALAMKRPLLVRPSAADVFTPYRLMCSLLEAGVPGQLLGFLPGGHELAAALIDDCAASVVFGDEKMAAQYAFHRRVRFYGPGRSKVIIGGGVSVEHAAEIIVLTMIEDSGRACLNTSAVIVEGDATAVAEIVAERVSTISPLSPFAEGALLGAIDPNLASVFDRLIDEGLEHGGRELTSRERFVVIDGMTIARPIVLQVPDTRHPLFGVELPFPFVVFASARREDVVQAAGQSLCVRVVGNEAIADRLLLDPSIHQVMCGPDTLDFNPFEPHQGFILDFLFHKKGRRFHA